MLFKYVISIIKGEALNKPKPNINMKYKASVTNLLQTLNYQIHHSKFTALSDSGILLDLITFKKVKHTCTNTNAQTQMRQVSQYEVIPNELHRHPI